MIDRLVKAKKMLIHTVPLVLSTLLGVMSLTVNADDPVPVSTEKLVIPLPTDNMRPIVIPTEVPRPKSPREPIQRPLPGPSRM